MGHDTANLDIVYLCRPGDNPELRYSLRSTINLPHAGLHIVGAAPTWFAGNVIPSVKVKSKHKTTNESMRVACTTDAVSDPFILFNDDFYITTPQRALSDYNRGEIDDVLASFARQNIRSRYVSGMGKTRDTLRRLRLPTLCYELHIPMVIHKAPMLEALNIGGQRRSVYGNLIRLGGQQVPDVKVYTARQKIPPGPFLSTSDQSFPYFASYLNRLLSRPSQYERPGA